MNWKTPTILFIILSIMAIIGVGFELLGEWRLEISKWGVYYFIWFLVFIGASFIQKSPAQAINETVNIPSPEETVNIPTPEILSEPDLVKQIPIVEGIEKLPHGRYLPAMLKILVEKKYKSVTLKELNGGYVAPAVFLVQGINSSQDRLVNSVLKLGKQKYVKAEIENHEKYVADQLGNSAGHPDAWCLNSLEDGDETPAGILYRFAQMTQNSAVQNFQSIYLDNATTLEQTGSIIDSVLQILNESWYKNGERVNENYYRKFPRLLLRETAISTSIVDLTGLLVERKLSRQIQLNNFPEIPFQSIDNPLFFLEYKFKKIYDNEFQHSFLRYYSSTIHGDLTFRNILMEESDDLGRNIWFIDFPFTGKGSVLRDLCNLEAEIKHVLLNNDLPDQWDKEIWDVVLEAERRFSPWQKENSIFIPTEADMEFLRNYPQIYRAWKNIVKIRRFVEENGYRFHTTDWKDYVLALLSATLPIVSYKQCTTAQKMYALISSSFLCGFLLN